MQITPVKKFLLSKSKTSVTVTPLFMMQLKRFGRTVRGLSVLKALLGLRVLKGHKAHKVSREKLVLQALLGRKVPLDQLGQRGRKDHRDHRVFKAKRARLVLQVLRGRRGRKATLVS
jgi:hypothetical protein